MAYDTAIAALSDHTRRDIFEKLARGGPMPVGRIAADMPVSRPAVSQHLSVLMEAGLVLVRPEGARRVYAADPEGLRDLRAWLDAMWSDVLAAFAAEVDRERH